MAFVHRQSCEGVKSELDLFAVPPTQTSIEDGRWIEHQPLTSLDSGGPIEFILPGTGDAYIDLANTYLLIRAKVVRAVGTELAPDTPVAPVNNWLHSLFSQVDVYLNELRCRGEDYSTYKPAVVQGHCRTHGCHDRRWWQYRSG